MTTRRDLREVVVVTRAWVRGYLASWSRTIAERLAAGAEPWCPMCELELELELERTPGVARRDDDA